MNDSNVLVSIENISYSAPQFDASVSAAERFLHYQIVEQGHISEQQAVFWGAQQVLDARYCLMEPSSGADFKLRFIESPVTPGYAPLKTYGWNATEFLVEDVYKLADTLRDSPYQIIGGPRDLLNDGSAIALQVVGPSEEVFYLTELNSPEFKDTYGHAQCLVDRAFIAVLGVQEHAESQTFWRPLCDGFTEPRSLAISVLSQAHDLDADQTKFTIMSAKLRQQYRIEMDEYPDSARPRPRLPEHLPPGMCMVTFKAQSAQISQFQHAAVSKHENVLLTQGVEGEWVEIVS